MNKLLICYFGLLVAVNCFANTTSIENKINAMFNERVDLQIEHLRQELEQNSPYTTWQIEEKLATQKIIELRKAEIEAEFYMQEYQEIQDEVKQLELLENSTFLQTQEIPSAERNAIIAFYDSTDGDNWNNNSGWKEPPLADDGFAMPGTEGNWYGITVTNDQVTTINMSFNNINGVLPPEIGDLTNLAILSITSEDLSGPIPPEIGNLQNIAFLNLIGNQIIGPLPAELGQLTSLRRLDLGSNQIDGSIPAELGNLKRLARLNLGGNQLSGEIPKELGEMENLNQLTLYTNDLSGEIPAELGNLSRLSRLALHWNKLSGCIPSTLGNLENLENFTLFLNELTGNIPKELGNLQKLTSLSLYSNQLSGSIPAEIGNMSMLVSLELYQNNLSGSIPIEICNLDSLRSLNLSSNQFKGTIPSEIRFLKNLHSLNLSQNNFDGQIPEFFITIKNLWNLDLSANKFSGSIPAEFCKLTGLSSLSLSHNELTGEIPKSLGTMNFLYSAFDLSYNQLTGEIPSELGNLDSLTAGFSVASNKLTGGIPVELGNLVNIGNVFDVSNNQLTGGLPKELSNLSNLMHFMVFGNQLSGTIPGEFIQFKDKVWDFFIDYNALNSSDSELNEYLDSAARDWLLTQTLAPQDLNATMKGDSIVFKWTPILYTADDGGYELSGCSAKNGEYNVIDTTADKSVAQYTIENPIYRYYRIRTLTFPHEKNQNTVSSEYSTIFDLKTVTTVTGESTLPKDFALYNNCPNPFNPTTTIKFDIPEVTDVRLEIININGQRVRTLVDEQKQAGTYSVIWDATDDAGMSVASGVYLYRLKAGREVLTRKLLFAK